MTELKEEIRVALYFIMLVGVIIAIIVGGIVINLSHERIINLKAKQLEGGR